MRCFYFLLLFLPAASIAQETVQSVVGSTGGEFQGTTTQVSWTIGEVATETLVSANYSVSQGFHQGNLLLDRINEEFPMDFSLRVYPNPVKDILTIKSEEKDLNYQVMDVNGRVLLNGILHVESAQIDFTLLPAGTYFLHVNSHKTYKIIKP